jgi:predicted  nucleic acid-binding Zn-ribbon protein
MEAATPLRHPHVSAQEDRVRIDGLVVADECAARLVRESADPDATIVDAVEIGARVLDREQTAANAEFVKTEFEKVSRSVEAEFGDRARAVAEQLGEKVDAVFDPETGHLSKSLDELFSDGSATAVQHRVKELVTEALQRSHADLRKQFASTDEGVNPLADFKARTVDAIREADERQHKTQRALLAQMSDLEKQLQGLRDEKQKLEELAEERERGTAKGRSYEESVAAAIDTMASVLGDVADPVGDEPGTGGKKGDIVVGIDGCSGPERGRIIFEAKDTRISKPQFASYLDESMKQRDAAYAVLVVPTPGEVPAKLHSLREDEGDKIVAVFDPEDGSALELEFAYRVARARVTASQEGADEIDAAAVRNTVGRAMAAMDEVRQIRGHLTKAENGIGGARTLLDSLEAKVRTELDQIDAALAPVDDGQGELPL